MTAPRIAVLMTCHDRRDTTLRCLAGLLPQLGREDAVFLVDDGSTDGTAAAVGRLAEGPGGADIRILQGDGTLYWAKGMETAWKAAAAAGDWDGYLWLNDDDELDDDAMARLKAADDARRVVVGEFRDSRGEIVYGMRAGGLFTGNFVYVPRAVYRRLGVICGGYAHAWADSDYALRCRKAGVDVVSCGVVGRCEGHPNRPSLKGLPLKARWRMLSDPKGWCLHDLWLYRRRNRGLFAAVFSCAHLILHVLKGER